MHLRPLILSVLLPMALCPAWSPAQTMTTTAGPSARTTEMDVQADKLEYKGDSDTVIARGNVIIIKGKQTLKADLVTYNTITEDAYASGNVVFANETQIWEGEELTYNFITGQGSFPNMDLQYDLFKIRAVSSQRLNDVQLHLSGVTITTCDDINRPEFKVKASTADVYEGRVVAVRNAVFYLRGVPFLYLPRYSLDLDRQETNVDLIPGYSSRDGLFLLTSYNKNHSDNFRTKTRFDMRAERGFAAGQDFVWFDPVENRDTTAIRAYYVMDNAPYRSDDEETRLRGQGIDVEENRYRLKFFHRQNFGETDTLRVKTSYLSDARVVQDFFDRDFREEPVPESRATYSAVGEWYTADLEVNKQINDEYFGSVNRLPEGAFTVPRIRLGQSDFLYESESRAGFLERAYSDFEKERGFEEYDTFRLHTSQRVFYPTRQFGWLNVVPRAGITYTLYGDTRGTETRVNTVSNTDTNGVVTTTFQTNDVSVAQSGDARILPEIGFETSFKAFRELHSGRTSLGRGLRHVVEPFVNYTYIPEPDLTPDEIYQFDRIDTLGETHAVGFGVRNKFQTKRDLGNGRHRIHDFADISVSSFCDLRSDVDEPLGDIFLDTEFHLVDWMTIEFDANYDTQNSEVNRFNTELRMEDPESRSWISLDQRFTVDRNNTLQFNYQVNPYGRVGLEGYTRYELENSGGMEEQHVMLTYRTDCVGYGLGTKWIAGDRNASGSDGEDDIRVWVQVWLAAFPRAVVDMGGR